MGTIIEATATASAHRRPFAPRRAEACRRRRAAVPAARGAGPLTSSTCSSTRASITTSCSTSRRWRRLIQEDIGANPDQQPGAGHGTFSFDVSNGACGLLTGIHLLDGLLASGTANLGMVVASDIDPQPGASEGFDFPAAGGAFLLQLGRLPPRIRRVPVRHLPGVRASVPELRRLERRCPARARPSWPEHPHRRDRRVLRRPGARVRRVDGPGTGRAPRRSTSARSISSWPRHRSRDSPTDWRSGSVSPASGSHRLRMAASVTRTRPRPPSRLSPERSRRRIPSLFVSAGAGITVAAALYRA